MIIPPSIMPMEKAISMVFKRHTSSSKLLVESKSWKLLLSTRLQGIIKVHILPWLKPLFEAFVLGDFLVTTIWIFHFTYQRFSINLITNIVLDFLFAVFPLPNLLQKKLGIYELVNITSWGRFLIFVIFSIIIYGYQKWQEEIFKPT